MARKQVIDLTTYSLLDQYTIGLNEYWLSLKRAGFKDDIAMSLLLEPATYPTTILPSPNWLPYQGGYYEDDEDED